MNYFCFGTNKELEESAIEVLKNVFKELELKTDSSFMQYCPITTKDSHGNPKVYNLYSLGKTKNDFVKSFDKLTFMELIYTHIIHMFFDTRNIHFFIVDNMENPKQHVDMIECKHAQVFQLINNRIFNITGILKNKARKR